jgi:O-antigen ligase
MTVIVISVPAFENLTIMRIKGIMDPHSDTTASWRIEGWKKQLSSLSLKEVLFGEGVGSYYRWFHKRHAVEADPHNGYVQIILKFGLLGLIVYVLLAFRFFRKLIAVRKKLPPGPMRAFVEMSILNFGAAHAYLMGYGFSAIMLVFYAIGMSAARLVQNYNFLEGSRQVSYWRDR